MLQYHPDKAPAGREEEFTERAARANRAKEIILRAQGLSEDLDASRDGSPTNGHALDDAGAARSLARSKEAEHDGAKAPGHERACEDVAVAGRRARQSIVAKVPCGTGSTADESAASGDGPHVSSGRMTAAGEAAAGTRAAVMTEAAAATAPVTAGHDPVEALGASQRGDGKSASIASKLWDAEQMRWINAESDVESARSGVAAESRQDGNLEALLGSAGSGSAIDGDGRAAGECQYVLEEWDDEDECVYVTPKQVVPGWEVIRGNIKRLANMYYPLGCCKNRCFAAYIGVCRHAFHMFASHVHVHGVQVIRCNLKLLASIKEKDKLIIAGDTVRIDGSPGVVGSVTRWLSSQGRTQSLSWLQRFSNDLTRFHSLLVAGVGVSTDSVGYSYAHSDAPRAGLISPAAQGGIMSFRTPSASRGSAASSTATQDSSAGRAATTGVAAGLLQGPAIGSYWQASCNAYGALRPFCGDGGATGMEERRNMRTREQVLNDLRRELGPCVEGLCRLRSTYADDRSAIHKVDKIVAHLRALLVSIGSDSANGRATYP